MASYIFAAALFISAKPDCFKQDFTITVNGRSSPYNVSGYYPVPSSENIDSAKKCQEISVVESVSIIRIFILLHGSRVGLTNALLILTLTYDICRPFV